MSGTSGDGIDAAVVRLGPARQQVTESAAERTGTVVIVPRSTEVLLHHHEAFDSVTRERVLAAATAAPAELALLHAELGRRFADASRTALAAVGLGPGDVEAIATTGLTVAHIPPAADGPGATLALGDGDVLAERSGCLAITDLRARDRAAGGQGAPLVPYADAVLLRPSDHVRAALNLGGIGNLTCVPPAGDPVAFDTGPGNMLLDAVVAQATGGREAFDVGGARAASGRIHTELLEQLVADDEFLAAPAPKSTGRERYGAPFFDRYGARLARLSLEDRLATLTEFTVESVALAVERVRGEGLLPEPPRDLVVSGGGALNLHLMQRLARRLAPLAVIDSERALGLPALAKEAVAMAILGDATLAGRPSNVPSVTGAARACVLGKLSPPPVSARD